jgi:hypothetical protein
MAAVSPTLCVMARLAQSSLLCSLGKADRIPLLPRSHWRGRLLRGGDPMLCGGRGSSCQSRLRGDLRQGCSLGPPRAWPCAVRTGWGVCAATMGPLGRSDGVASSGGVLPERPVRTRSGGSEAPPRPLREGSCATMGKGQCKVGVLGTISPPSRSVAKVPWCRRGASRREEYGLIPSPCGEGWVAWKLWLLVRPSANRERPLPSYVMRGKAVRHGPVAG